MKQEEQRILAGSLNLLPPSDKTPENDAIELINFRVDQSGVLRVAEAFLRVASFVSGTATPVHTLVRIADYGTFQTPSGGFASVHFPQGAAFFVGVGTNLFFWTPGSGGTYTLLASGLSGNPFSLVSWNGFLWLMDTARQLKINLVQLTNPGLVGTVPVVSNWLPAAPTSPPTVSLDGAPGGPNGTYVYYCTEVNDAGLETMPGPPSAPITASNQAIDIVVPVSSDLSIVAYRLYRSGGTLGQAYQVANGFTNPFFDDKTDLVLTEFGVTMPGTDTTVGDNDPPPAAFGLAGPYFNRQLAWGGPAGNRLYWSQDGVPLFPGSSDPAIGNWVNVGASDDAILAVTLHPRVAVIYKQRSIWRLIGDPVSGVLEQSSASVGTVGLRAVASAGQLDYFLSTDGLFAFNLDSESKQSEKLDPVFFGTPDWTSLGSTDLPLHTWTPVLPFCAWLEGTLFLSDGAHTTFLFHPETGRFAAFAPNLPGLAVTAAVSLGSSINYYIGDSQGFLNQAQNTSTQWSIANIFSDQTAIWQTRFLDQGLGDQPKSYTAIVLDAELNGATATLYAFFAAESTGAIKAASQIWQGTGSVRQKFYIDRNSGGSLSSDPAPHISLRLEILCFGATAPPAIHGLYLYYHVEARATNALLSQAFPLDPERGVWQVKELEYDLASGYATVSAELLSDLPGNALAARQTATFGADVSRRNYQAPQTAAAGWWLGRLFQVYLSSTLTFRLYGARMLARKVGVYIEGYEGLTGFLWDSWYEYFGSLQVKVFDQVKLEVETAGLFTVSVSTELDGIQGVIATQSFAGTGPRAWCTIELPFDSIGRAIRVTIAPTADCILHRGSVSMRSAGHYLSGAQGDQLRTLEQDFGSEHVKLGKKLEIDLNGTLTLTVWTDEPGGLAARFTTTLITVGRQTKRVRLPPNVRGRIWRIDMSTTAAVRLYAIRGWMRVIGEAGPVEWNWQPFALEPVEPLAHWGELLIAPTPDEWTWVPIPVADPAESTPVSAAMLPYAS